MDLSAVIFVVLALAWAAYLIPKALRHHDEMASDRLVQGHSEHVRILSRKAREAAAEADEAIIVDGPTGPATASEPETSESRTEVPAVTVPTPRPTRTAAKLAARRRRRVLGALVLALVVVWALTWLAYLPIWAPAVPGVLVVAWLVLARLSVRKQQHARHGSRVPATAPVVDAETPVATSTVPAFTSNADDFLGQLADEDTGLDRVEIEDVLASEGSLWDPLPMTLPTYVNKARARRTVRTIELTGISSSGHSETDSSLAREAAESAHTEEESTPGRKVAGA